MVREVKKEGSWGDDTVVFQYLKEIYQLEENQPFTWTDNNGTRGNCFQLREVRFRYYEEIILLREL